MTSTAPFLLPLALLVIQLLIGGPFPARARALLPCSLLLTSLFELLREHPLSTACIKQNNASHNHPSDQTHVTAFHLCCAAVQSAADESHAGNPLRPACSTQHNA
jgi:hypothetical protein